MADAKLVATLIDSTSSKLHQLQQAFSELESHGAVSLNFKWKELEAHFHGLEMSLKKRFNDLEDQEMQYKIKESQSRQELEKKEAVVLAKEQASLDQLQVKRDAALSVIFAASGNYKHAPYNVTSDTTNGCVDSTIEKNSDAKSETINCGVPSSVQYNTTDPSTSSPLFSLCKDMDVEGLHKFISDNRRNLVTIRGDMPAALRSAPNCFHLVLNSLKDFYAVEMSNAGGKKDSNLIGLRRTCLMLLESCYLMLTYISSESDSDSLLITSDIKTQAKRIADEWKTQLGNLGINTSNGNSLEAHAFLQLLATFDIASDFNQDEICSLIPSISRRRQAADLCRSLGLSERIAGLIEALLKGGRQIEAVNLVCAFGLTDQFSPVLILKTYLKEAKKNETAEEEISALKAIIKCVEEHKLENQYPLDSPRKRIVLLEKAKTDKKRVTEVAKPQSKRARANGLGYSSNGCGFGPRPAKHHEKSFYRAPERYPYAYDRQYMFPTETHASPLMSSPPSYGSSPYSNVSPNHGGYYISTYQYHNQAPYIH